MAAGGVQNDSDLSLSEEGELESTRLGDIAVTRREEKHKKRKVQDLSWVSPYKGDERYQREFDEKMAREEEELYWSNVRADKRYLEDQYTALNEELVTLVRERDQIISENQQTKAEFQEEATRLREDRKYMQEKVQKECHAFQEAQAELNQIRKQTESSQALGVTYAKELQQFSKEWHVLKKGKAELALGTDRLVKENEETRRQILEETEDLKAKRKAEVEAVCTLEARKQVLAGELTSVQLKLGKAKDSEGQSVQDNQTQSESLPVQSREVLKQYDPFQNANATQNVSGNVYKNTGKPRSIGMDREYVQQQTAKNKDPQGQQGGEISAEEEVELFYRNKHMNGVINHSYGSLNPFHGDDPGQYGPSGGYDAKGNYVNCPDAGYTYPPPNVAGATNHELTNGGDKGNPNARRVAEASLAGGAPARDGTYVGPTFGGSAGATNPLTGVGAIKKPRELNRRISMSPAVQKLHDSDPAIRSLGLDCASRGQDSSELLEWSRRLSDQLSSRGNAAKRVARITKPYKGIRPWKEEYQTFIDDCNYNCWSKEESLGPLIIWLSEGPVKIVVNRWRSVYGSEGTYNQLERLACYSFGDLVTSNHWTLFQTRTQKPKESAKIYGLELQRLLQEARPEWSMDAEYYIEALFVRFISGLSDPEHCKVAGRAWKAETSIADIYMALDQHDKKKILLAGMVPASRNQRVSGIDHSIVGYDSSDEEESEGEERVDAFNFKGRQQSGTSSGKFPGNKKNPEGTRKPDSRENNSETKPSTKTPEKTTPDKSNTTEGPVMTLMETMITRMNEMFDNQAKRRPRVDRSTVRCYRCQVTGHYAAECKAEKPVLRSEVSGN